MYIPKYVKYVQTIAALMLRYWLLLCVYVNVCSDTLSLHTKRSLGILSPHRIWHEQTYQKQQKKGGNKQTFTKR